MKVTVNNLLSPVTKVSQISSGSAVQNLFNSIDVIGYSTYYLHVTSLASGTLSIQVSGDNQNWVTTSVYGINSNTTTNYISSISVTGTYADSVTARYMKIITAGYSSGSIQAVLSLTITPFLGVPAFNCDIFKTATATANGDSAIWTPTSGKKFRLMGYSIQVTADSATAGGANLDFVLRDGTSPIGAGTSAFIPAVAGTAFGNGVSTGWIDIRNGFLSSTINNVLNINLTATLTSGKVRVCTSGSEE